MESLRKIKFFSTFSLENIDSVLRLFQKHTFPKNKTIINESDPGKAFYIIHSGKVGVFKKKALWIKTKLAELIPGDFFGEMSLISDQFATATIISIENTEVFVLLKSDFDDILIKNPELAVELLRVTENRRIDTQTKA